MHRISNYIRRNLVAYLALFVALTGTSAYAANTVFSADIVDGEVKAQDLGGASVINSKLAPNSVGSGKITDGQVKNPDINVAAVKTNSIGDGEVRSVDVLDNTLTGADINESTLALAFQGTAKVVSKRVTFPVGTNGDLVLDVPGFGEVRTKTCSGKSARTSFFNDTAKTVDAFANISRIVVAGNDPQFEQLAPGEEIYGTEIEGKESATYQVGFGSASVATIVVMSRGEGTNCVYQAQATID
jgi:hypothetical protein